jgi:hypothetical protein
VKSNTAILILSALSLVARLLPAQTQVSQVLNDLPSSFANARCQYTPTAEACAAAPNDSGPAPLGVGSATVAQLPRRIPGPPIRPRRPPMAHPSGGYPGPWMLEPNGRHAAIGALIGFGLGAAHPVDGTVRGHVAMGLFGGLLGAVIGAGIPSFHARSRYPRGPWSDHDGDQLASRSAPAKAPSTQATTEESTAITEASP